MASISSVITGGFGTPGSASLVITDGYGTGAAAVVTNRAGRPRRGRRPIWKLDDGKRKIDAQALREAKAYLDALAAERALTDLLAEQRILQDSLEIATARQRKQIAGLISTVERRIVEIEEEEVSVILLT